MFRGLHSGAPAALTTESLAQLDDEVKSAAPSEYDRRQAKVDKMAFQEFAMEKDRDEEFLEMAARLGEIRGIQGFY